MEKENELFERFKMAVEQKLKKIGDKYNDRLPPRSIPFLDGYLKIEREIILGIAILDSRRSTYITHNEPFKQTENKSLKDEKEKINYFISVPFNKMYTIRVIFSTTGSGDEENDEIPILLTSEKRNNGDNYICYYEGDNVLYQILGGSPNGGGKDGDTTTTDLKQFLLDVFSTNLLEYLYDEVYGNEDYIKQILDAEEFKQEYFNNR